MLGWRSFSALSSGSRSASLPRVAGLRGRSDDAQPFLANRGRVAHWQVVVLRMTPVLIGKHQAGSVEWLAERRYRIGGSEIAAVLGLSPWASRFTLYAEKKGVLPRRMENPEQEWGKRHERTIWDRVREEYPDAPSEYAPGVYAHMLRSWQVASPDGMLWWGDAANEPVVVEIKTAQRGEKWGKVADNDFPVYYRTQLIWTMSVMQARVGILAVLIGLSDFRMYYLNADEDETVAEDLLLMLTKGLDFVDALRADDWPSPDDGSAATYEALRVMHPEIEEGTTVELDGELATRFILSKADLTMAEKEWNAARAAVAEAMGTAQFAYFDGQRIASRYAKTLGDGRLGKPYVEADRRQTNRKFQTIREAMEA